MGCVLKGSQKPTALQVFGHAPICSSPFPYYGTLGDVQVGSVGPRFQNDPKSRESRTEVIPRRIPPDSTPSRGGAYQCGSKHYLPFKRRGGS